MAFEDGKNNGLWREFFATKERGFAWIIRALLALLMSTCTALGWGVWNEFSRMRDAFEQGNRTIWITLQQTEKEVGVLARGFTDHVREDQQDVQRATRELDDHESRIRVLEHSRAN